MGFDKSLYASQIQQLQQLLEIQFNKNIAFFQKKAPEIAKKFARYDAEEVVLRLSDEGYLNLFNKTLNNKPVYSYDPQQFCQDYVDQFIQTPNFYYSKSKKSKVLDESNVVHIEALNRCVEILENKPVRAKSAPLETTCNFMLLNGIGMGYIIPQILEHSDIKNLVVIEPNEDIFHASLHILDWVQVYQHFETPYHTLELIVGQSTKKSIASLRKHLNRIGLHNAANPYVIDHLSSKELSDISKKFLERIGIYMSSTGYFDDEQVSLAHTIENWRAQIPPLREHASFNQDFQNYPVFLIANGPSLDAAKDFLTNNSSKAFIISCGTTIGSLNRLGITPDFHIEMERTRPVVEWLSSSTDEQYRKDIILMALNTVHPEVYKLFDVKGMGMKVNDLGTHFFSQYLPKDKYAVHLANSNPTVANAGLAFATALGFTEIYFIGLDLGFSSGEQHHSKLSTHYKIKEDQVKGLHLYEKDDQGNTEHPANFGGTLTTTPVYLAAKISIEECMRTNPKVKCYNTSNGILINDASPTKLEDIRLEGEIENKKDIALEVFKKHFFIDGLTPLSNQETINKQFDPAVDTLKLLKSLFNKEFTDWESAQNSLCDQHNTTLALGFNKKTEYVYSLLKGSIYAFNLKLSKALYAGNNRDESLDIFNEIRVIYLQFIDNAIAKISSELFKLDEKSRNLDKKIKK